MKNLWKHFMGAIDYYKVHNKPIPYPVFDVRVIQPMSVIGFLIVALSCLMAQVTVKGFDFHDTLLGLGCFLIAAILFYFIYLKPYMDMLKGKGE